MEGTGMQLNGHELEFATVKDLLRARAALGEKLFAIVADERLTYAGANDVANRIASSLHTLGVEKGDVVATYMQNSVDHICTWFACAKLGAVWAPLNIALVNLDLAYTIQNAAPRVLVVDDELLPNLLAIHDRLDPGLTIVVRGEADGVAAAWPTFEDLGRGAPEEPEVEVRPSDPAGLIYTGGSTGLPKGVLVSNLWYFPGFLRYREMFEPGPEDVHLGLGQMCHTIGSAVDVLTPLYLGMSTVLSRRFSASRFWEIARRHGTTITVLVGPLMTFLLNQPARPDDAENTIRIAGTATGQVPREVPVRFAERFDVDMLEVYGQTETGPLGCVSQRRDDRPYHSVGRPHGWAEVMIADADDRPCPPGVVGEIAFRSSTPIPSSSATTASRRSTPRRAATCGSTRATSATSTRTATCTSTVARRTRSGAAARTSPPSRWSRRSSSIRRSPSAPWSACRATSARRTSRPTSCSVRGRRSTRSTSCASARSASRTSRSRATWSSPPSCRDR